ncbi:MAG: DUF2167 domain-containing protein [Bacteroidota bacterium]
MRYFYTLTQTILLSLLALTSIHAQDEEEVVLDSLALMEAYQNYIDSVEQSLNFQTGTIQLGNDLATLDVPEGFRYLDPEGTKVVLEDLWGNPPQEEPYLGMLFPAESGPLDDNTWGINISYDEEGYIEDDDAKDIDYDELLADMQESMRESNVIREEQGYGSLELIGWAKSPYYDSENKKLYWAKELRFDGSELNTLNYDIRILGRRGYLSMNAIADMNSLSAVEQKIEPVLASVSFNEGNRYSEFDPSVDEVAAYGIAGLVAGKLLAKGGFFVLLAKFWKVILVGVIAAGGAVKKFFFGGKSEEA